MKLAVLNQLNEFLCKFPQWILLPGSSNTSNQLSRVVRNVFVIYKLEIFITLNIWSIFIWTCKRTIIFLWFFWSKSRLTFSFWRYIVEKLLLDWMFFIFVLRPSRSSSSKPSFLWAFIKRFWREVRIID